MTTSSPSPRQARQALRWVVRSHAGPLSSRQTQRLQRWLQSHPCNLLAWQQQNAFWQGLDAAGPEVLAALPQLTAEPALVPLRRRVRLPLWLAAAAVLVVSVALAPQAWLLAQSDVRSSTLPRAVRLADGSQAVLDAGTALAVDFSPHERRLRLLQGRAWFQVDHQERPFVVEAGSGRVRDIGTAFSVGVRKGMVTTEVSQGEVEVRTAGGALQRLSAGQARTFEGARWVTPLASRPVADIAPWRRGEVSLEQVTAAQAIAELARYRSRPVWVLAGRGAEVKVSGLFHLSAPDAAISAVAAQAGLHVQPLPGDALLLW